MVAAVVATGCCWPNSNSAVNRRSSISSRYSSHWRCWRCWEATKSLSTNKHLGCCFDFEHHEAPSRVPMVSAIRSMLTSSRRSIRSRCGCHLLKMPGGLYRLYSRRRSNSSNSSSNNKKLQQTHSHAKYVNGDTLLHKNEFARKPCYFHTIDAKIWMIPKNQWLEHDTKQCRYLETVNCQLF